MATVGVFDGVHRGHQALLARVVELSRAMGARSAAVTFDPHPGEVLRPDAAPPLLATVARRLELLAELGLDEALVVRFDQTFAALSPKEFFDGVLRERLHVVAVVAGENFRFGHRGAGDLRVLGELGAAAGVRVETFALRGRAGDAWSSTAIRGLLAAGDVRAAAAALGRPHRLPGRVVAGDGRGHGLGFPTLNLAVPPGLAWPADGVYAGWAVRDAACWAAAVSVGTNPTFGGTERRVEAHLIDASVDWRGEEVAVDFAARLRDMRSFRSAAELVAAMGQDVADARGALAGASLDQPEGAPDGARRPAAS